MVVIVQILFQVIMNYDYPQLELIQNPCWLGIQCRNVDPATLPKDVLKFVDEAPHGVIFVSFGTVLKPSKLAYASLIKLVNVFGRVSEFSSNHFLLLCQCGISECIEGRA